MKIKEPELEKRESDKGFFLLDNYKPEKETETRSPIIIEVGGIVQVKYHGRRIGLRITKAAGFQFVGKVFIFESPNEKFDDLHIGDYIKFNEENIFGYGPPDP
jgi:hypothetical protein